MKTPLFFISILLFFSYSCSNLNDFFDNEESDYLVDKKKIYWAEGNKIWKASIDGTDAQVFTIGNYPTDVTINQIDGKVYWTDNGNDTISRANSDGSNIEVIYTSSDKYENPQGIAVYSNIGTIYWAEGSKVWKATIDGTDAQVFTTGNYPTDVTIDPIDGKVYWTDNGNDTISRANSDGSNIEVIYTSSDKYSNPQGIAIE